MVLKEKAFELGLYSGKGALSANGKALAAYNVILDSTRNQQGDAAKTSKNLAGQKRILTAQLKDLQAEIGEKLLPAFTDLVTTMNEADFEQIAQDVGKIASAFVNVLDAISKAHQGLSWFLEDLKPAEEATPELLKNIGKFIPQVGMMTKAVQGVATLI